MAAQDWPYLYEKNYKIFSEAFQESKKLSGDRVMKQENYIYREQEYRKVI